jgi:hypothetical protein
MLCTIEACALTTWPGRLSKNTAVAKIIALRVIISPWVRDEIRNSTRDYYIKLDLYQLESLGAGTVNISGSANQAQND